MTGQRRPVAGRRRAAALGANAVLALSVVLLPWYALDEYVPTGWQATWLARAALALALVALVLLRLDRPRRELLALSVVAFALVAFRVAVPPDFGFDFEGLAVPTQRRFGCFVGLAAAALAVAALVGADRRRARREAL